VTIKEATASAFTFHQGRDGSWRMALIWHPRLEEWMPAGGHVERDETAAEAVLREILEEGGWKARLVPGPAVPLPAGFPHAPVAAPWWTVEMRAGADNHTREPHVHIDHVFVAVVDDAEPLAAPAHEVRWFTEGEVAEVPGIAEDSRLQAKELFGRIADIAAAVAV
jgi:ADP-ribose pyrophosphatase YjhB (NUDIX family)